LGDIWLGNYDEVETGIEIAKMLAQTIPEIVAIFKVQGIYDLYF
jgi:hypothetical protein